MFGRVLVLNLDRRPDRWDSFRRRLPDDWPLPEPERFSAVDGRTAPPPAWWTESPGAWGCFESHRAMWREAGEDSVLILEDDAFCVDRFAERLAVCAEHLPDNWDQLYLGGQHLRTDRILPQPVNPWIVRCYYTGRTHAYAIRGRAAGVLLRWSETQHWNLHVDYVLARLQQAGQLNHYAPREWLFGQVAGRSDVAIQGETGNGALMPTQLWQLPELTEV